MRIFIVFSPDKIQNQDKIRSLILAKNPIMRIGKTLPPIARLAQILCLKLAALLVLQ